MVMLRPLRTKAVMLCITLSTFFMEQGCVNKAMGSDLKKSIGTASMAADGVLTLRLDDAPKGQAPEVVKPSDADYQQMLQVVGEIKPGEQKSIFESIGTVHMEADGRITYALHGIETLGSQFLRSGQSKPGDADYNGWISRVGGLKPGETKSVPAQ